MKIGIQIILLAIIVAALVIFVQFGAPESPSPILRIGASFEPPLDQPDPETTSKIASQIMAKDNTW
jgi:hypothetical protein